jgi:hypothetical protein
MRGVGPLGDAQIPGMPQILRLEISCNCLETILSLLVLVGENFAARLTFDTPTHRNR